MSHWWSFYLFSVSATGDALNWTALGPAFLSCLFVLPRASLDVTEALSSRKYKAFPEYQAAVSRFVPWFPSKPPPAKPAAGRGKSPRAEARPVASRRARSPARSPARRGK